jgi:hypothetical protein
MRAAAFGSAGGGGDGKGRMDDEGARLGRLDRGVALHGGPQGPADLRAATSGEGLAPRRSIGWLALAMPLPLMLPAMPGAASWAARAVRVVAGPSAVVAAALPDAS